MTSPDFTALAGVNLPELAAPGASIGNLFATARFASPADVNGNGSVDTCDCLGDVDGSGAIDAADLAQLLGGWGSASRALDLSGDGIVDANDLAALLGAWGPCP